MSKSRSQKDSIVTDLKNLLQASQLALLVDYQGLTVAEVSDLRNRLRPTGTVCKVAKNTLMELAVQDNPTWQPMTALLKGPTAFLFVQEDIAGAVKAYQEFQKAAKKTELKGGVMEGRALTEADVKAIVDLPPREVLLAQIAGALNAVPSRLAGGLRAVPTQLVTGVNEVPASLLRAIKALSDKEGTAA